MKHLLPISLLLLSFVSLSAGENNLLKNPGFEEWTSGRPTDWTGWITTGQSRDAFEGSFSLRLLNREDAWSGFEQTVPVDPKKNRLITLRAFVKGKGIIRGPNEWDRARIVILFYNEKKEQVGGWPELGRWDGSFGWSLKEKTFEIPSDALSAKIQVILGTCKGDFQADSLFLSYGRPERKNDPKNLLLNGGLEYGSDAPEEWHFWNTEHSFFVSPGNGKESLRAFVITRQTPGYALLEQTVPLNGRTVKKVRLSCDAWLKDIRQGDQEWEKARFNVEFLDGNKEQINGWPIVGQGTGSTGGWIRWESVMPVPTNTRFIRNTAGILNTTGEIRLDNFLCQALDEKDKIVTRSVPVKESRTTWRAFRPDTEQPAVWQDLDLSFLLDAPAGKHGFARNEEGVLLFGNGTRARFWGVNVVGSHAFPSREDATRMARRLSSIGCNMVRFHHMDASWARPNIFGNDPDSTRTLSPEMTDRLDWFVSELIREGIYIYLDLLVHRKPEKNDGIADWQDLPEGLKGLAHFHEPAMTLQKDYARSLLTRTNKYTGRRYTDEPAIVMTEIINESTLFYVDRQSDLPERYRAALDRLFNDWLLRRYRNAAGLSTAWATRGDAPAAGEDPRQGTVRRARLEIRWDDWLRNVFSRDGPARQADTKRFYYELQKAHYEEMAAFLRSLGFQGLITGSNHWERFDADILSNMLDHIDRHSYYDHPDTSRGWSLREIRFRNASVLKDPRNNIAELASSRVAGLPFIITEWNIPVNNEFRSAGPVMMAAYANFQDWDGLLQFPFDRPRWSSTLYETFDISAMPSVLCQWIPAALLFHKGYVRRGETPVVETVGADILFDDPENAYRIIGNDLALPLAGRVAKRYDASGPSLLTNPADVLAKALRENGIGNDTGELVWDLKTGLLTVDTPFIQGFTGESSGREIALTDIRLKIKTPFASIFLVSLDGEPLSRSKRMVLASSARAGNTDWEYNNSRTEFLDAGTSPIVIEPVTGEITFKARDNLAVRVSDDNGRLTPSGKTGKAGSRLALSGQVFFREFTPGR